MEIQLSQLLMQPQEKSPTQSSQYLNQAERKSLFSTLQEVLLNFYNQTQMELKHFTTQTDQQLKQQLLQPDKSLLPNTLQMVQQPPQLLTLKAMILFQQLIPLVIPQHLLLQQTLTPMPHLPQHTTMMVKQQQPLHQLTQMEIQSQSTLMKQELHHTHSQQLIQKETQFQQQLTQMIMSLIFLLLLIVVKNSQFFLTKKFQIAQTMLTTSTQMEL